MNEVGTNSHLTVCEDVIRTAVQDSLFSWRMQRPVNFYFAAGERRPTGTHTEVLSSNTAKVVCQGCHLACAQHTHVGELQYPLQQFRCHLKSIAKPKGTYNRKLNKRYALGGGTYTGVAPMLKTLWYDMYCSNTCVIFDCAQKCMYGMCFNEDIGILNCMEVMYIP